MGPANALFIIGSASQGFGEGDPGVLCENHNGTAYPPDCPWELSLCTLGKNRESIFSFTKDGHVSCSNTDARVRLAGGAQHPIPSCLL